MLKMQVRQSDGTVIEVEVPEGATPVGFVADSARATQLEPETKRSYQRGRKKAGVGRLERCPQGVGPRDRPLGADTLIGGRVALTYA